MVEIGQWQDSSPSERTWKAMTNYWTISICRSNWVYYSFMKKDVSLLKLPENFLLFKNVDGALLYASQAICKRKNSIPQPNTALRHPRPCYLNHLSLFLKMSLKVYKKTHLHQYGIIKKLHCYIFLMVVPSFP